MDSTEKWGVDVEEAVKLALIDLKAERDEVEITVLEEPTKGFLGIGAKLAKVKVERKKKVAEKTPEKKSVAVKKEKKDKAVVNEDKNIIEKDKNQKNVDTKSNIGNIALDNVDKESLTPVHQHEALTFIRDIAEKMNLELSFSARTGENLVYIEIQGKDASTIIGKRGQTLDSVQYLTSLVVNKDKEKYVKVVIDAENYRAKRQKTLEQLANRLADKVIRTGKYVRLEPMNPYERKVIHATLQGNPNIITRSEGDEPYRRVIIEIKK